ncbi:hypothetical protein BWQ96_05766 [Gracilariopsis chorda]|uniref:Uncharacterized protein n=1 Tax=Gracilariopsis chorda TaxID=448386 RepID=A0A2V3IQX9_9FLOR|nr:hypothetical protein BWQ96_05766 [Gracilariopsis chorda]|eukprot:PXF44494.1 hypothetical protein BWQ96_05766 [Gracilariopsis chorda]
MFEEPTRLHARKVCNPLLDIDGSIYLNGHSSVLERNIISQKYDEVELIVGFKQKTVAS